MLCLTRIPNICFLGKVVQNPSLPVRDATPEDLIRSTKDVTLATAKAVAAGNSCQQDDIITAANMGRKAVTEMLIICKVSWTTTTAREVTRYLS